MTPPQPEHRGGALSARRVVPRQGRGELRAQRSTGGWSAAVRTSPGGRWRRPARPGGGAPPHDPRARRRKGATARADRGVASLEYLGMLPFLLLIALAGIQLGLVAYCGEQAGTAARTAARTAALPAPDGGTGAGTQAGRSAVSDWLDPVITWPGADGDAITARARISVPSVLPGVRLFGDVSRTATMPREDTTP
jgi:hypothetical protein